MAFIGNFIWFFLCGGFFLSLGWLLLGLILCLTIVGIPFGIAAFRIAGFTAFPFGKELVDARLLGDKRIAGTGVANVLWVVIAGFWLALSHVIAGIGCFLMFILVFPIYFGMVHFKLAQASFAPLGKRAVTKELAQAARNRFAETTLDHRLQVA